MITRRSLLAGWAAAAAPARRIEIRAMYSSPKPFWDKGARLDDYGVNAVFVHGGSITGALIARAKEEGARVFAEFATLNGKGYVEKHPEAWPVNEQGERAPAATWFLGACPTEPGFRAWRLQQLEELLDRFPLAGVWMDYLHWHAQFEDPKPVLPETCFSATCLEAFQSHTGIRVPPGSTAERARWILKRQEPQWRNWREECLAGWAKSCREVLKRKQPDSLLGAFHCPWTDADFDGARRRTLGLDYRRLAGTVDVFSPMVYHGRMGRTVEWVGESVRWLSKTLAGKAKIWPIVQAHNDPGVITAEEFERALTLGVSGDATGVMMFTAASVAQDEGKMRAMRRLYRSWMATASPAADS